MGGDDAQRGWVTPFGVHGRPPGPLELGAFPACGFRLLLRPRRPLSDDQLLDALGLGPHHPLDPAAALDRFVVSVTPFGPWTHVADDYGLWNDRDRRKAALRAATRLGDLFTFQLPDPDMAYAFAWYRGGRRLRLRVVGSPRLSDQVLDHDVGEPLPGEPADWRGEPFPMMVSIARGLGVDVDRPGRERFYVWGRGRRVG